MNHIFFHNDIDGIMSAAFFINYHKVACNNFMVIYPVQSTMRGNTLSKMIDRIPEGNQITILDFEYHPRASIWFDHHFSEKFGQAPVNTGKIFYDPSAKSAAQIICNEYKIIDQLIDEINMIDSASYPDVKFIFESDSPLMILRAYLETAYPSDMMYSRIVEMIVSCDCDIQIALQRLRIDYSCVKSINGLARKASKDMVIFGGCSVIHQCRQNEYPRYSEYYVNPDIKYAIRITHSDQRRKYIQIGHNPWGSEKNPINIGEFMRNLSYVKGGGHYNVAAGTIMNEDEEKFLDDVDMFFNSKDVGMEKYAVDKEDPIEAKAQEMVKTGMDITKAREQSQKEVSVNADSESKL